MKQFQVHKQDIKQTRLVEVKNANELSVGQVKVKIAAFSFTANNISYWATGDKLAYWQFFPAAENANGAWGIIPVWGFADVVASNHVEVLEGERLFGYFPTTEEWVMQPTKVSQGLWFDGSSHRLELPVSYNMYRRVKELENNPQRDALQMLLFPLHITSFCLHDMLSESNWFDAEQIIITSASSKTSLGLAFALHEDESSPEVIAMTSAGNLDFVMKNPILPTKHYI